MNTKLNFISYLPSVSTIEIIANDGYEDCFLSSIIYFNYAFTVKPVIISEKIETVDIKSEFRIKNKEEHFHNLLSITSGFQIIDSVFTLSTRQVYDLFNAHYKNCHQILTSIELPKPDHQEFGKLAGLDFGSFPYHFSEKVAELLERCGRTPC